MGAREHAPRAVTAVKGEVEPATERLFHERELGLDRGVVERLEAGSGLLLERGARAEQEIPRQESVIRNALVRVAVLSFPLRSR